MDTQKLEALKTKWQGRTEQLFGKAKELWGDATDDAVTEAQGSIEKFIGSVKEKTGKTEEEILDELDKQ